ncbi:MAG: outer membrane lipoprotein-sorting protein [Acidobacteria bacterium]|nr:outer membrane lipoprotein-sorting protein [Acidobacteriota bacterium]
MSSTELTRQVSPGYKNYVWLGPGLRPEGMNSVQMGGSRPKHKRMSLLWIGGRCFPGAFLNRADKRMVERIKARDIRIDESMFGPESCRFKTESLSKGWRLVWNFTVCECAQRICKAGWNPMYAAVRPQIVGLLFLCFVAAVVCASAQTAGMPPTVETIIARMAKARSDNQARFRPYTVTRDYKLFGKEREKTKAQVIADIIFIPPNSKRFAIQKTNGTGFGERVVRRMLTGEVEIAKDYNATEFSPDNYDFRFIGEEHANGQPCYVLELIPKRKEKNLLRGSLWVDADTYLPRRAEGEPAKNPSWWVRNTSIALFYEDVGGMWLQTALEGKATVRLFGSFTVVSSDLKYEIGQFVAVNSAIRAKYSGRTHEQ